MLFVYFTLCKLDNFQTFLFLFLCVLIFLIIIFVKFLSRILSKFYRASNQIMPNCKGSCKISVSMHSSLSMNYSETCLMWPLKIDKTKVLKPCGILMQVKSTAECSMGAFCNTFDLH